MKSKLFLFLIPTLLLASCSGGEPSPEPSDNPVIQDDPIIPDDPVYAEWPTDDIQSYVKEVTGYEVIIPSFNKAKSIEIDTENVVIDGFFAIYCYTDSAESESEYAQLLVENEWEVESEKVENYFNAYDKDYKVWMNFAYDPDFGDLEIYITQCTKTRWPEKEIADAIQELQPGSSTVIPKFDAYTVITNFYPNVYALAINAYGFEETIINDYKKILQKAGWSVFFNEESLEWNAISPAKDIEIHFYLDSTETEFNVDVVAYQDPQTVWPAKEIAETVNQMGATGTVIPFSGDAKGFKVDTKYYPPVIFIYCDKDKQESYAEEYNQSLLDAGYELVGTYYGDPLYAYPETTLAYRAVVLVGVLQIELFNLNNIDL